MVNHARFGPTQTLLAYPARYRWLLRLPLPSRFRRDMAFCAGWFLQTNTFASTARACATIRSLRTSWCAPFSRPPPRPAEILGEPVDSRWKVIAEKLHILQPDDHGIVPEFDGYAGETIKQADIRARLLPTWAGSPGENLFTKTWPTTAGVVIPTARLCPAR